MNKIKVSELPDFDASESIKTVDDVKDWLKISIQEDNSFEEFKMSLDICIKAIDNHISKMN